MLKLAYVAFQIPNAKSLPGSHGLAYSNWRPETFKWLAESVKDQDDITMTIDGFVLSLFE